MLLAGAGAAWYYHWKLPYGRRDCCLPCLIHGLRMYAHDNDGWFPDGNSTSIDSLRKLFPVYATPLNVAGVSGDVTEVKLRLERGASIDDSVSSWVYWPGLRNDDDPGVALIWERAEGVTGIGVRTKLGGHVVGFVDGSYRQILQSEWPAFVKDQEVLRSNILQNRNGNGVASQD